MNYNKLKIYGKTLRLKRGIFITLFLTFKCNLLCPYCILSIPSGTYPKSETIDMNKWKEILLGIKPKIKEISISGGEPTLYPDFTEFCNYLLSKGYHVKIYTNLTNIDPILKINNSYRLLVRATYHHMINPVLFVKNYCIVKQKHRIDLFELGEKHLDFSTLSPLLNEGNETDNICIAPDGDIFIGCPSMAFNKST